MRASMIIVLIFTCSACLNAQESGKSPLSASAQQSNAKPSGEHTGKFGDLSVTVSEFVLFPANNGRATLEAFVKVANLGKGVVCASIDATLNTTFGLQYYGGSMQGPEMQEMLPGEAATGNYMFNIKDGVQPLELVFKLASLNHSIRCGPATSKQDVLPNEIRLDVRDMAVEKPLPTIPIPHEH
jgi:hypothetical protein